MLIDFQTLIIIILATLLIGLIVGGKPGASEELPLRGD